MTHDPDKGGTPCREIADNGLVKKLRRSGGKARSISVATAAYLRRLGQTGFGRHSAVPALRRAANSATVSFSRQLFSLAAGSSLIGIAIALLVHADLGLPPNDVMSSALSVRLGLTLGQTGWATAGVLFVVATLLGRRPSWWGIGYIFANGAAIDAASGLLTQPDTMGGRWAFVVAAIILLPSGVSLVVYSGTTGGPFELLMLAGEDRGVNRIIIRYGLEIGVFAGGIILGGSFGPATIVYALTIGLVLRWIGQALIDHGVGRRARLNSADQAESSGPPAISLDDSTRDSLGNSLGNSLSDVVSDVESETEISAAGSNDSDDSESNKARIRKKVRS